MDYSISLEVYRGRSSRYTCPSCRLPQEFSRYVDNATGNYVDDTVGRCNREKKCGYHYPPNEFFRDNPGTTIAKTNRPRKAHKTVTRAVGTKPFDSIDQKVLLKSIDRYEQNNFVQFLCSRFPRRQVKIALGRYSVGTWNDGWTVFWQRDELNRIRSGKLIKYDPVTGNRQKHATDWVHTWLMRNGQLSQDFQLKQCLFGAHLLSREPEKSVGILESEKSAIIMSIHVPEFLWLATGGLSNLSGERLKCLKGRKIVAFPDGDGFDKWTEKIKAIRSNGLDISISNFIEETASITAKTSGLDLADIVLQWKC